MPQHDKPEPCDVDFRRNMAAVSWRVRGARTDAFIARIEKEQRDRGRSW